MPSDLIIITVTSLGDSSIGTGLVLFTNLPDSLYNSRSSWVYANFIFARFYMLVFKIKVDIKLIHADGHMSNERGQ